MPIFILEDFSSQIANLGLKTYACVVDENATHINELCINDGCIFLIGNEANGLTKETQDNCDYRITIPMKGRAESLNAAVAASIVMWEMMK